MQLKKLLGIGLVILTITSLLFGCQTKKTKNGKIINQGKASDVIVPEVLKEVYGDNICYSKDVQRREISFK